MVFLKLLLIVSLGLGSRIWANPDRVFESPQEQATLKSLIERALVADSGISMEIAVSFEMKSESRVRKYFKQSAKDFLGEEWDELYPEGVENYTGFENAAEHDPGFTFESSWNRAARDIFQSKIIDRSVGDLDSKKELKAILEESIFDAHHVGYSDHNSDLITGDLFLFGFWASEELGDQGKRIILKVTIKTES